MKKKLLISIAFISFLSLIHKTHAINADTTKYRILSGQVRIVAPNCDTEACKFIVARLSGTFHLQSHQELHGIRFLRSMINATDNVEFHIPRKPNSIHNGTVKKASIALMGDTGLSIEGSIDSRSDNGSFVEYRIYAETDGIQADPSGYYLVRPDFRQCAFPECGGFFVKSVNKVLTRCIDDSLRTQCYVATIPSLDTLDPSDVITDPNDNSAYLVQGRLKRLSQENLRKYGTLKKRADSVIYGGEYESEYPVYLIENNDVKCFPPEDEFHPVDDCPRYKAALLNTTDVTMLAYTSAFGSTDVRPEDGMVTIARGVTIDIDGESFDGSFIFEVLNKTNNIRQ